MFRYTCLWQSLKQVQYLLLVPHRSTGQLAHNERMGEYLLVIKQ